MKPICTWVDTSVHGSVVGKPEGTVDGSVVGESDGTDDGSRDGSEDGTPVGPSEGETLMVGTLDGNNDTEGWPLGTIVGVRDGISDTDGVPLGAGGSVCVLGDFGLELLRYLEDDSSTSPSPG